MSQERKTKKNIIEETGNTLENNQKELSQKSMNPSNLRLHNLSYFNAEVLKTDTQRKATIRDGHDFIGPFVRAHSTKNGGLVNIYIGIFFSLNLKSSLLSISDDLKENNCTLTIIPSLPVKHSEIRDFYEIILTPKESIGSLFLDSIQVDVIFSETDRPLTPFLGEPTRRTKVIPPDGSGS